MPQNVLFTLYGQHFRPSNNLASIPVWDATSINPHAFEEYFFFIIFTINLIYSGADKSLARPD